MELTRHNETLAVPTTTERLALGPPENGTYDRRVGQVHVAAVDPVHDANVVVVEIRENDSVTRQSVFEICERHRSADGDAQT